MPPRPVLIPYHQQKMEVVCPTCKEPRMVLKTTARSPEFSGKCLACAREKKKQITSNRKCLGCGAVFKSVGNGNRCCEFCSDRNSRISDDFGFLEAGF